MLHIIKSYEELDGPRLMQVYAGTNLERTNYTEWIGFDWPIDQKEAIRRVEETFLKQIREEAFPKLKAVFYVLEENGEWVSALELCEIKPGFYRMDWLETRPDRRAEGCATRLLRLLIDDLKAKGPFRICSNVEHRNYLAVYTELRCGFQIVSVRGYDYFEGAYCIDEYRIDYFYNWPEEGYGEEC